MGGLHHALDSGSMSAKPWMSEVVETAIEHRLKELDCTDKGPFSHGSLESHLPSSEAQLRIIASNML